ncbi:aspartyl/asparaginyl beta-hydroxylase domain-containing protein [Sphingopyxis sp.]|uniref:aspartyl/asparaginyl beta-hydroxylase domain-containing protein n=1 Tax=Sphingopyxis sp. TaxID=1908224 RepID=UPI003BAA0DFC
METIEVQLSDQEAERLAREGVEALGRGKPAEARERFERVTRSGRANAQIWMLLAVACDAMRDMIATEAAADRLLAIEPHAVRGLILKGDCREAATDERAALAAYEIALRVAGGQTLPDDLIAEVRRVDAWVAAFRVRVQDLREVALASAGFPPESRSARFQQSLDILNWSKRIYVQEPTGYYFPELPQIQFFDTGAFDWVSSVEAATHAIRQEIQDLLDTAGTGDFRPYIQSEVNRPRLDKNPLLDSKDWSALFLCENGRLSDEIIARCPATWDAVQAAPLPWIVNSPTAMFSLLRAGARINPHTGMHNARLTCHLPLIVPPGCRFRVGNDVREWEVGKLIIFDDSIEHEAWNESAEDRIVLIFDIWRPELSEQERQEVAALFRGPATG